MIKKSYPKKLPVYISVGVIVILGIVAFKHRATNTSIISTITKPSEESFVAPGKDWPSAKKVEDYFVSNLHMSPEEAHSIRSKPGVDGKVMLRLAENSTIDGLVSNLEYYGFVKDKNALIYALENSTDTVPGHQEALKVGTNTVDTFAYYRISENMTTWEIADQLLNHPTYFAYDEYHYMFMP
jgi:hypothetical protein